MRIFEFALKSPISIVSFLVLFISGAKMSYLRAKTIKNGIEALRNDQRHSKVRLDQSDRFFGDKNLEFIFSSVDYYPS